jgi:hypothetical protein
MKANKNKLTDEQKRIKNIRGKAIFAAGALTMGTIFGGCKDSPTDPAPTCDSFCIEKVHGEAPCNCGGTDCTCKQKYFKFFVDGVNITIENHTNEDITEHAERIKSSLLSYINVLTPFDTALTYLKNNGNKGIIIIENQSGHTYEPDNYRVINNFTIATHFEGLLTANDIYLETALINGLDAVQYYVSKSIPTYSSIYLVNGKPLSTRQFIAFEKSAIKNINGIISRNRAANIRHS